MTYFKLLIKEIKQENKWGQTDVNEVKRGNVAFSFKGKTDDTDYDLKKGAIIAYQHGTPVKIKGEDYQLVSLTSLIWQE